MLKFRESEIKKIANKITRNSEIFADELSSVIADLTALLNSANELGCELEGVISDCWGREISVSAIPNKRKHSWTF